MYKKSLILFLVALFSGCSTANIFKGPDDFNQNFYAGMLKDGIDDSIQREINRELPNGYLTKEYSEEIWNEYWNNRIFYIYNLGPENTKSYKRPTGPEFIRYIIDKRRENGLPELNIEARNIDKIKNIYLIFNL